MSENENRSKIDAGIVRLNQDPYLLAAISAVPGVGGSITQVITGIGQQIVQERNRKLFERLSVHLATVEEQAIRQDYFETPEGFDLLIKALDESRKTRSDEKRELIARVLAGAAATNVERGDFSPEEYINIVSSLTAKELGIARTIYDLQRNVSAPLEYDASNRVETWRLCEKSIREKHSLEDNLSLFLNRITATGLITMIPEIYADGYTVPTYWVTPTFDKLIEFLSLERHQF